MESALCSYICTATKDVELVSAIYRVSVVWSVQERRHSNTGSACSGTLFTPGLVNAVPLSIGSSFQNDSLVEKPFMFHLGLARLARKEWGKHFVFV